MVDAIDEFFVRYEVDVRATARTLRAVMYRAAPDAKETLHVGWECVSYGYAKKFCAIAPHTSSVNLQLHAGTELNDPCWLLTGTGRSMRHVKLIAPRDVKRTGLTRLVREAIRLGRVHLSRRFLLPRSGVAAVVVAIDRCAPKAAYSSGGPDRRTRAKPGRSRWTNRS